MDALARTDEDDEKTDPWQAWVRDFPEWKEGRHAWDRVARDIREHAEDKPEMVYGAMMNEVQAEAIPDIARQARQYQLARPDHNDTRLRHEIEYRRMMTARARKRFFPGAPTMCYASVKDRMLAALAETYASREYVTQWLDWLEAEGGGQREELFWAQMDEETEEKDEKRGPATKKDDFTEVGVGPAAWNRIGMNCPELPAMAVRHKQHQEQERQRKMQEAREHAETQRAQAQEQKIRHTEEAAARVRQELAETREALTTAQREIVEMRKRYASSPISWQALLASSIGVTASQLFTRRR